MSNSFRRKDNRENSTENTKNKTNITPSVVIDKPIKLSEHDIKLANTIKEKLRKTAETIIEIGESIAKVIEKKPKGYKELFYKTIGMSVRSAQRYMQIANHKDVQALKLNKRLEGKTMSDLLLVMSPEQDDSKPVSVQKVVKSFYARYKDKPNELKEIMIELQKLIDAAKVG